MDKVKDITAKIRELSMPNDKELFKLLEWIGTEKFTFDGISIWQRELYDGLGFEAKYQPFTTKQLIQQYFVENK